MTGEFAFPEQFAALVSPTPLETVDGVAPVTGLAVDPSTGDVWAAGPTGISRVGAGRR